jgi:hypothetical protein
MATVAHTAIVDRAKSAYPSSAIAMISFITHYVGSQAARVFRTLSEWRKTHSE